MRARVADITAHDHHKGAEKCPLCRRHDHSDTRVAGWIGGVPVKCWEIACPRCGTTDLVLGRWTDAGREVHAKALAAKQEEEG